MASKRFREETQENDENLVYKKSKPSVIDILSLLEQEEDDDSTEDLSSLIKILEQELSTAAPESDADGDGLSPSSSSTVSDDEERERVMRHLLEASDDELGLPVVVNEVSGSDGVSTSSGEYVSSDGCVEEGFDVCDGLMWQMEDDVANYYQLMQSGF